MALTIRRVVMTTGGCTHLTFRLSDGSDQVSMTADELLTEEASGEADFVRRIKLAVKEYFLVTSASTMSRLGVSTVKQIMDRLVL